MKKITLLSMLFIISVCFSSYAQISEDFETDPPTGWTFMQTEGDDPGFVQTSDRAHGGTFSFYHNDDNITSVSTSWMISPSHTVSMGEQLLFWYNQNFSVDYNVYTGVWISTASADPISNPGDFTELFEFASTSEDVWTEFVQSLDAYNGQTIYVAFKYTGDWADELYIDDFSIDVAPTDTPFWYNIQYIADNDNATGSNTSLITDAWTSVTAYAQVYEEFVTDSGGQGAGIECWIGGNDYDTDPSTWPTDVWGVAVYYGDSGNNDEYKFDAVLSSSSTFYLAARWRLNGGPYVYGGYNGPWDGTTNNNIELIVNPLVANDNCDGAIALTPGATFGINPVDGTVVGATENFNTPSCGSSGPGVWYSIVVPADGNITIETGPDAGTGDIGFDSVIEAYSGTCSAFVSEGCNDDVGTGTFSLLDLTGLTPSSTIYVRVWEWGGDAFEPFAISAYNATLGVGDNKIEGFRLYPNPVNDLLNFSSQQTINDISIYSLLGQEVMRAQPNTIKSQVDISNLATGMYVVKVQVGDKTGSYRIIKE